MWKSWVAQPCHPRPEPCPRYNQFVQPRIAIPVPHSTDPEYAERSIPQYERAIEMAGGEPVRIPLDQPPAEVMKLIERCDAVLLPGSKADVDPAKYDAPRAPKTAAADAGRDTVDELLLQDAYNLRKPILGICYGLQTLNVYRTGTLIQHIQSPVNHAAGRKVPVAHAVEVEAGSKLAGIVCAGAKALFSKKSSSPPLKPGAPTGLPTSRHAVALHAGTALGVDSAVEGHGFSRATLATKDRASAPEVGSLVVPVNSSHHQ